MIIFCIPPVLWALSAYYCYYKYRECVEQIGSVSAMLRNLRAGVCERRMSVAEFGPACANFFPEAHFDTVTDLLIQKNGMLCMSEETLEAMRVFEMESAYASAEESFAMVCDAERRAQRDLAYAMDALRERTKGLITVLTAFALIGMIILI